MNRFLTIATVILSMLVICSFRQASAEGGDEKAVRAAIEKNLKLLEANDIDGYMKTIDPSSPGYETTRTQLIPMMQYELKYTLEHLKVLRITGNEAQVEFTQTTRKVKGPEFRNNTIKGIHTLKKINGTWYLSNTKVLDIKYL